MEHMNEPPIVITGGSVTIVIDESQIAPSGKGRFYTSDKKIERVVITGDYDPATGYVKNGNVTVTVYFNDDTSYNNTP